MTDHYAPRTPEPDEYLVRFTAQDDPTPEVVVNVKRRVDAADGRVVFAAILGASALRAVFYLRARSRREASARGRQIVTEAFAEAGLEPDEMRGGAF
jgi:hypothetical protein